MSRGLGSMQRAIISALDAEGGKVGSTKLRWAVANNLAAQGRYVIMDLSDPTYGAQFCTTPHFYTSFYRALNGLEKRGLVTWYKGCGGLGYGEGEVVATP
jgi:hypothetical protein